LKTIGVLSVVALFGLVAGYLWIEKAMERLETASMLPGDSKPRTITVRPGTAFISVAGELQNKGLVDDSRILRLYARYHDLAAHIQAGEYAVEPGMSAVDLLHRMVKGQVVQHSLTVVEGWTFDEMVRAVVASKTLTHELEGLDDAGIMEKLGYADEHPEGRFLPETYQYPRGTTDVEFLRRAHEAMDRVLREQWEKRADDLPYDKPYSALIMASIIEKETAVASERPEIAGVFVRRLKRGMRLQTDPTVIYGLGDDYDGDIRYRDLRKDTPYNTYTRAGLPPTPIALPGVDSIHAALHPADGKALYFVARGDGSHVFSETLKEHNRAVRKYQLGKSQ
jgi:UPF0755 protein